MLGESGHVTEIDRRTRKTITSRDGCEAGNTYVIMQLDFNSMAQISMVAASFHVTHVVHIPTSNLTEEND